MLYVLSTENLADEDGEEYGYYWIEADDDALLEWPWLQGVRFDGAPETPLRCRVDLDDDEAGGFSDYVAGALPLVTDGFRAVLDACGASNIQYFPIKVQGAESFDAFPAYFAINVVGLVSAAGPGTRSTQFFGVTGADLIDKLVVDEEAISGLVIFRLAEHLSTLVVSDHIRIACLSAGLDTLSFTPLSDWSN